MRRTAVALVLAGWGALAAGAACGGSFTSIGDGEDATAGDGGARSEGGADVAVGDGARDATQAEASGDTGPGMETSVEAGADGGDAGDTGGGGDAGDAGDGDAGEPTDASDGGTNESGVDAGCPVSQVCEPAVPSGWQGPIDLVQGANGPPAPCPAPTVPVFDAGAGFDAGAPACSTCGCAAPSGLACEVDVRMFSGGGCNTNPCATGTAGPKCTALTGTCPLSAGGLAAEANAVVVAGACTPSKQDPTVPPASWSARVEGCGLGAPQACAAPGATGGAGACLPAASRACIYQSGAASACPDAGYVAGPQVFYESVVDDRSCTACECGGADASCSGGTVTASTSATCALGATIAVDGGCAPLGFAGITTNPAVYAQTDAGPVATGGCPASGGAPTGGAAPAEPITVCCLP